MDRYKKFGELSTWSISNMGKCKCGGCTVLFYDEKERYRVECNDCDFVVLFNSNSMVKAKDKWNNYVSCDK